jgi:hypothetical protein
VVGRAFPSHITVEEERKFDPLTVIVNPDFPATAEIGLNELTVGAGFEAGWEFEVVLVGAEVGPDVV